MPRRFVRSGRRSGPRRTTFWESTFTTAMQSFTNVASTIANVQAVVLETELDNVPNPTLVRVRGQIFTRLGAVAAAQGDAMLIGHALLVVDAKQLAVGTTAVPLPLTGNSEDFLWYGTQYISQNDSGTILNTNSNFDRLEVDSKAMRKITVNQVLVLATECQVLSGTGDEDFDLAFNFRFLFKR